MSICVVHPSVPVYRDPSPLAQTCKVLSREAYPLLSRFCDVLVRIEEAADVECLAAPEVAVDSPVERELERAAV
jgi:hypothetical protein